MTGSLTLREYPWEVGAATSGSTRPTLNEAEVDPEGPYYHYLQVLAAMLDGAEARASGTN
jgi:hypothetical protein